MRGVAAVTLRLGPVLAGSPKAWVGESAVSVARAIVRDHWERQRFDLINNVIRDNVRADVSLAGAGFSRTNATGTIKGNVIRQNSCGRGAAGFLNDATNKNTAWSIEFTLAQ
jgi:hypothetical protein